MQLISILIFLTILLLTPLLSNAADNKEAATLGDITVDLSTDGGEAAFKKMLEEGSALLRPSIVQETGELYVESKSDRLKIIEADTEAFEMGDNGDGAVKIKDQQLLEATLRSYNTISSKSLTELGLPFNIEEDITEENKITFDKQVYYVLSLEEISTGTNVALGVQGDLEITELGEGTRFMSAYSADTIRPLLNIQIMQTEDSFERLCFNWQIDAAVHNVLYDVHDIIEELIKSEQCFLR